VGDADLYEVELSPRPRQVLVAVLTEEVMAHMPHLMEEGLHPRVGQQDGLARCPPQSKGTAKRAMRGQKRRGGISDAEAGGERETAPV
jgi:hypothetical protein